MGFTYDKGRTLKGAVINEMLFGQSKKACLHLMNDLDVSLDFDFDDFYICLGGIPKQVYSPCFGKDLEDYFFLYGSMESHMREELGRLGVSFDSIIVKYDGTKRVCLLFTVDATKKTEAQSIAMQIANELHETLMRLYKECWNLMESDYVCTTVLPRHVDRFENAQSVFGEACEMANLSTFLDCSCVLDRLAIRKLHRPFTYTDLSKCMFDIEHSVAKANEKTLDAHLRQLFKKRLQYSFNRKICSDAVLRLGAIAAKYLKAYFMDADMSWVRTFEAMDHSYLESAYSGARKALRECAKATQGKGDVIGEIVSQAISVIRADFKQPLTLNSIASSVNVSPSTLSRQFNRETGISVPIYLSKVRLNHACLLLEETSLSVSDIARTCGFSSASYFNSVFKRQLGMAPRQYRMRATGTRTMGVCPL